MVSATDHEMVALSALHSPDNKKPHYQIDSGVFNVFNNLTGGPGRNRTTDTRIFNPHVLVFAIVELCWYPP